ncbi:MAG TPA: SprB repeat-containing protein, partial [Flavobacteriales bacterium]|nr:SprB repeat-containing protein [Flavobacteriales bacterium]
MKKSISIGNFNYLSRLYRTFSGKMIHKLTYCFFVVLLLFLLSAQTIFAQQKEWTIKEPFEKRFFIENLGQFNEHEPDKKTKILFGSHTKGINIYFTDRGFIIQYSKKVKRTHRELEELEGGEEKNKKSEAERRREEEMLRYKDVPVYEEMVWETVNDKHGVLSFDKIETKHCYPYNDFKSTYQAEAWKKIRYVEIYPGIDVEFYFPGDSAGFKYNYIVKPGADTRLIKENWNSKSAKELSVNGDLGIKAVFGDVVVKKPVIITSEKKPGPEVKFKLDRKTVSYEISSTVSTDFIIDPWVITPVFASTGDPYDIDVDIAGNVYIYGGIAPFSLNKYNASGTLLWTYYLSSFTSLYGDFAVDYNTGSVYIVNGFGAPVYPSVHKLSTTGALVATYPYSTDMNEMWRIVFSSCTNQAVIGGGGVSGLNQISYLDTSLTSITSVNAYSTTFSYIDIALLAVDNFGSCYFLHAKSTLGGAGASPFANNICKAPIPSFLPMTYAVPTSYSFYEVIGLSYNYGNGVNGMAIGDKTLYSYDSYVLNKYNATSGALLLSKTMHVPTSSASSMNWTGISVDECQNLFVASKDTIVQFDSLFNEINRYPMSGNVTDIKLKNGIVYSCGIGFVSVMVPSGLVYCTPSINPNFTSVNATCNVQGSATVNPSGGTAPYTVYWNTIPIQYGLTATDLAPGTYTVYISDSTCSGNFTSYEFSIGADSDAIAPVYTVQDVSCYGLTNGSINITPTGGTAPYSYYLDSVLVSGGSPISGLNAGTYLVTIIDSNNCYSEFSVKVKPPGPDINVSYTVEMFGCGGDSVNLTAVYSGGIAPYTLAWNTSPVLTTETVYGLSPNALYSLTVTDGAGCSKTYTDSIEAPDSMYITMNLYEPLCDSLDTGALTGIATGGVYVHDYAWSHDPFIGFGIATGLGPGIYTLTVTDAIGCVVSATDTLTYEGFSTNVNLQNVSCNGFNNGAIELINSGGTPAYAYTWDTLSGLSGNIVT